MEVFLTLVIGFSIVITLRIIIGRKANARRQEIFETLTESRMGQADLDALVKERLTPALDALKKRDFLGVTATFWTLQNELLAIVPDVKITGFLKDWGDRNLNLQRGAIRHALKTFVEANKLFEPEPPEMGDEFFPRGGSYSDGLLWGKHWQMLRWGRDWVAYQYQIFPLARVTAIELYSQGQKIVNYTSRASLTSAVVGAVLPGSSLLWALARPKVERHEDDLREMALLIIGGEFELDVQIEGPNMEFAPGYVRQLQQRVDKLHNNVPAKDTKKQTVGKSTKGASNPLPDMKLEKLVEMYSLGLLSEEEFTRLKLGMGDS